MIFVISATSAGLDYSEENLKFAVSTDLSGFDVEYNFSIDSLPWWTKSVHLEHSELFKSCKSNSLNP